MKRKMKKKNRWLPRKKLYKKTGIFLSRIVFRPINLNKVIRKKKKNRKTKSRLP